MCSASCWRCLPSLFPSRLVHAACNCQHGTKRLDCPVHGINSGRCACNKCSLTKQICLSTKTSLLARMWSRPARPSCAMLLGQSCKRFLIAAVHSNRSMNSKVVSFLQWPIALGALSQASKLLSESIALPNQHLHLSTEQTTSLKSTTLSSSSLLTTSLRGVNNVMTQVCNKLLVNCEMQRMEKQT